VIRHVRDLTIATYRSQATCQHWTAKREYDAVLHFVERASKQAEFPAIYDGAAQNGIGGGDWRIAGATRRAEKVTFETNIQSSNRHALDEQRDRRATIANPPAAFGALEQWTA
jgi:hypothetical protein